MVRKKVFVGMSGGVDSSVSAALLKKEGYDVTGVFIKVWQPDFLACTRGDDRREAMRVAAHLRIPFLTFDLEKEYKKEVVDYMVREYKAGRTPNPDVMCNQRVKFGAFFKKARALGADYVATGHYAQRSDHGVYSLKQAKDKNKDQTYFLWTLTDEHLKHTLFPVGGLLKPEVRKLAKKFGLPNAEREESQGLCFVGEFKLKDFLGHFIPSKRGNVLNENGDVIGFHDGVFYYTLGQRHGFTVIKKKPNDPPLYVVEKNIKKNTLIVSPKGRTMRSVRKVFLHDVNLIQNTIPHGKNLQARFRYRQPLQKVKIKKDRGKYVVLFKDPQIAVTSGQSLVLYEGKKCLGGGVIT